MYGWHSYCLLLVRLRRFLSKRSALEQFEKLGNVLLAGSRKIKLMLCIMVLHEIVRDLMSKGKVPAQRGTCDVVLPGKTGSYQKA